MTAHAAVEETVVAVGETALVIGGAQVHVPAAVEVVAVPEVTLRRGLPVGLAPVAVGDRIAHENHAQPFGRGCGLRRIPGEPALEEKHLVGERHGPVGRVVRTGTHQKIVPHALPHQLFVEIQVHPIEEILITAVENERQLTVPERSGLADHRMRVPAFRIVFQLTQLSLHLPRVGERTDVHASRGRPRGPEAVFVAQRHPQSAVTAHAQSRDGASLARRNRQVAGIDPVGQLLRHEGLELRRRIEGTVPIPTVGTVGADDDHPAGIGQRAQVGDVLPRRVRTAETMQQVEHGHAPPDAPVGNHDQRRDVAPHLRTEDRHRVDPCGGDFRCGKNEKQNKKVLSHSFRNLLQKRARTKRTP